MRKLTIFGTPINPSHLVEDLVGSSFCVSFFHRKRIGGQLDQVMRLTGKEGLLLVDNGAYSFWRSRGASPGDDYWDAFDAWAYTILRSCPQAVAVAPDRIDGGEEENHRLLMEFMGGTIPWERMMPVWHLSDSLDYLEYLLEGFCYVAFGSSGAYAKLGTRQWHQRIGEAFAVVDQVCAGGRGIRRPHIHMMRAQSLAHLYPFDSSDSSSLAMNHWRHRGTPDHLSLLAQRVRSRIEGSCDMEATRQSPAQHAIDWRTAQIEMQWLSQADDDAMRLLMETGVIPVELHVPAHDARREVITPDLTQRRIRMRSPRSDVGQLSLFDGLG